MEQVRPRYRSAESRARMGPDGVASRRRLFFVHKASERAYKIGNSEGMAVQCGGSGRKGSMSRCWHCSRWRASSCWPMATSIPSGLPAIRAVGRLRRLPQRSRPPTRRHPVKTIRAGSARISAPSAPASAWPVRWSCRRLRRCCPVFHFLTTCIGRSQPPRRHRSTFFISTPAALLAPDANGLNRLHHPNCGWRGRLMAPRETSSHAARFRPANPSRSL